VIVRGDVIRLLGLAVGPNVPLVEAQKPKAGTRQRCPRFQGPRQVAASVSFSIDALIVEYLGGTLRAKYGVSPQVMNALIGAIGGEPHHGERLGWALRCRGCKAARPHEGSRMYAEAHAGVAGSCNISHLQRLPSPTPAFRAQHSYVIPNPTSAPASLAGRLGAAVGRHSCGIDQDSSG
jgi:hypothetical protein